MLLWSEVRRLGEGLNACMHPKEALYVGKPKNILTLEPTMQTPGTNRSFRLQEECPGSQHCVANVSGAPSHSTRCPQLCCQPVRTQASNVRSLAKSWPEPASIGITAN